MSATFERLDERDEEALVTLAYRAAERGVAVLDANFPHVRATRLAVERKASAIDLVTEVDRESERAVVDELRASGIAIVAEEGTGASARAGRTGDAVWFVDPLDGTTNYAHGHPFFCVSIGLVVAGVPRLGVVWAPRLGLVWFGTARAATRRDLVRNHDKRAAVSPIDSMDDALLTTGFPYDRRTSDDDNAAPFRAMLKQTVGVVRCGSAAIDLCLVADGTYEAFWERKLKAWDLAAGACIVVAGGGRVTDPWGRPFRAEEGAVLASNGRLHEQVRLALAPHLPEAPPRV